MSIFFFAVLRGIFLFLFLARVTFVLFFFVLAHAIPHEEMGKD